MFITKFTICPVFYLVTLFWTFNMFETRYNVEICLLKVLPCVVSVIGERWGDARNAKEKGGERGGTILSFAFLNFPIPPR